jgi:hypothetical protein
MTFEAYLRDALRRGRTTHSLQVTSAPDGRLLFTVRPGRERGYSVDFLCEGATLTLLALVYENGHEAVAALQGRTEK